MALQGTVAVAPRAEPRVRDRERERERRRAEKRKNPKKEAGERRDLTGGEEVIMRCPREDAPDAARGANSASE